MWHVRGGVEVRKLTIPRAYHEFSHLSVPLFHSTKEEREGETRLGLVMYPQKWLHANTPRDPKGKGDNVAWEIPVRVHRVRLVHHHVMGVVGCVGRFRAFDHRASWGGESSKVRKEEGLFGRVYLNLYCNSRSWSNVYALMLSYPIMG